MELDILYPNKKDYYERQMQALEGNDRLSEVNREDLKGFSKSLVGNGKTGKYRTAKVTSQLRQLLEGSPYNLRSLTIQDLQTLTAKVSLMERSEATKADYRRAIKQFYKYFEYVDKRLSYPNPKKIKDADIKVIETTKLFYTYVKDEISPKYKRKKIEASEIITDEDAALLIKKGCSSLQEQAIIALNHETGGRLGDIFLTKVGGYSVDSRGIGTLTLGPGKTGIRQIDIIDSVPYLNDHLRIHPLRGNAEAPLFYYHNRRNKKYEPYTHSRAYQMFRRIFEKAGLKKRSNPHWMRHSRASLDALDGSMSESVRKARMGWADDSRMIANYTHLDQKGIRNAYLKSRGLEEDGATKKKTYIRCGCDRQISAEYPHCPYCGRPTSSYVLEREKNEAAKFTEEVQELLESVPQKPSIKREFVEVEKFALEILRDPKLLQQFNEFRKQFKSNQ